MLYGDISKYLAALVSCKGFVGNMSRMAWECFRGVYEMFGDVLGCFQDVLGNIPLAGAKSTAEVM